MGLIEATNSTVGIYLYRNPFSMYRACCGLCGKEDYYYLIQEEEDKLYLRKYRIPFTYLGRSLLYDPGEAQIASLGAGTIVGERFYFFNQHTKKVEWFELKDHFEDLPQRTPILSVGEGNNDLHFYEVTPRSWSVTSYKDRYLFHCDGGACRIIVTDLDGNYKGKFGQYGSLDGQFNYPAHCAVYHSPIYGDVLFVADRYNGRISVWKINSIEPFDIVFLRNAITGLLHQPLGIGIWRNQAYVSGTNRCITEFKIEDDCSFTSTGVEEYIHGSTFDYDGVGLYVKENTLVVGQHIRRDGSGDAVRFYWGVFTITPIENTLIAGFKFEGFSVVKGIWHTLPFSIFAGQTGVWKSFKFKEEGYAPLAPVVDAKFKFSCSAKHDVYAMIQSFGFSGIAEQRMIREFIPFSFLGHSNFVRGNISFSIDMDIIITEFLTGENVFTFEMIANSPLTFKTELTFEVPEAEGTLVNDTIATLDLALAELILLMLEAPKVEIDLPSLQTSGTLASPTFLSGDISIFALQLQSLIESPFSFDGRVVLNMLSISALTHQPDLLKGNLVFSSVKTNGIAYQGFDYAEMELVIEPLSVSSQMATIPLLHAFISLPALEIDAHEGGQIASIEEIYQNSSLTLTSGEYPQVDGVELLGVAINLLNKSISRIANTDYMIIDLGYLDLHRDVVNQYLEIFISGYTPNQNQPIGELQIGNYSYLIEEWITENEWRVLVGKGLTRRTVQNTDKRFIPIKLKLKPDFELRSIVIRATPVARRGR